MTRKPLLLAVVAFVLGAGCTSAKDPSPPSAAPPAPPESPKAAVDTAPTHDKEDPRVAHAKAALLPLKKQLKAALVEGMKKGPEEAITACQLKAPAIAKAVSNDVVAVGRTSHKVRSPANQGPAWARKLNDQLLDDKDLAFASTTLPDGSFAYAERIMTGGLCLTCHGADLAPGVKAALQKAYPDDKATGFKAGDMRGVFWAQVAASSTATAK